MFISLQLQDSELNATVSRMQELCIRILCTYFKKQCDFEKQSKVWFIFTLVLQEMKYCTGSGYAAFIK